VATRDDDNTKASFKLNVIEAANADLKLHLPIQGKAGKKSGMAGMSAFKVLCARLSQLDWPSKQSCMSRAIISGKTGRMSQSTIGQADQRLIAAGYLIKTTETYKNVPVYRVANPRPDDVKASIKETTEYNLEQEAERKQEWRDRQARHANVPPSVSGTPISCPTECKQDKTEMSHQVSTGRPTECRRDNPLYPTKGLGREVSEHSDSAMVYLKASKGS